MGGRRWTEEEEEFLRKNYRDGAISKIAAELGRSSDAVKQTAAKLKLKKRNFWTEDELIYLEYFVYENDATLKEAAEFLGRSLIAVRSKLHEMRKEVGGIGYMGKQWTKQEEAFIKNSYQILTCSEIASRLSKSTIAVSSHAFKLGLKKTKKVKEQDAKIRTLISEGYYLSQISRELGINKDSLWSHCVRNKIPFKTMSRSEANKNNYWRLQENYRYQQVANRQKEETK